MRIFSAIPAIANHGVLAGGGGGGGCYFSIENLFLLFINKNNPARKILFFVSIFLNNRNCSYFFDLSNMYPICLYCISGTALLGKKWEGVGGIMA